MTAKYVLAIVGVAAILVACGQPQPSQSQTYTDSKRGVQLQYPADWSVEDLAQQNVLLLSSPLQEANWQTNVFLELRTDLETSQSSEQRLSTLAGNLGQHKTDFALQSSRVFTHASGLPAGELLYTHTSKGVPLRERELVLWFNDGRVLFVTGSTVTTLWNKYESQLDLVFDSIRPVAK
jgi:hypothetical protein